MQQAAAGIRLLMAMPLAWVLNRQQGLGLTGPLLLCLDPQAGGYPYSVASSGSSGSLLHRSTSGRPVQADGGKKRRGLMLRIFDTLRWAGRGPDVLVAVPGPARHVPKHRTGVTAGIAPANLSCNRQPARRRFCRLLPYGSVAVCGPHPAGANATRSCLRLLSSCRTPRTC